MLKIGVIGTGAMGKNHARVCSSYNDIELAGISDTDQKVVTQIARIYETKAFYDYKDLIPEIDAAIIATPTTTHYEIALDLIENGKHLLIEKPICDTVEKAKEITNLAKKKGVILATGHIERHNPMVKFVKEAIDKKEFGELITVSTKRVSNFPGRIHDVGVILDFGVHDIDVMRYLMGDVKSVYAKAGKFNKDIDHEDYGTIVLTFENDKCGIIEVNWLTPIKIRKLLLTCSEKYVEADYINQSITVSSSAFNRLNEMDIYHSAIQYNIKQIALQKREPLRNEIEDFIHAINDNRDPLATGDDGVQAVKIAQAAIKSFKTCKEVKI